MCFRAGFSGSHQIHSPVAEWEGGVDRGPQSRAAWLEATSHWWQHQKPKGPKIWCHILLPGSAASLVTLYESVCVYFMPGLSFPITPAPGGQESNACLLVSWKNPGPLGSRGELSLLPRRQGLPGASTVSGIPGRGGGGVSVYLILASS